MKTEILPSEEVLKSGSANHQRGVEAVGGKLYLTNQRIVFESHKFNVQAGSIAIPLNEVDQTNLCWTKFLNVVPIAPNSLAVLTKQGEEHKFVLFGRSAWKSAIDSQATVAT